MADEAIMNGLLNKDHSVTFSDPKYDYDVTSSISSELDSPGTRPTLTSAGRISPHRVRSLREQETQLQELKKENFGLKLRIYHLEEALRKRHGELNEDWEMNIQLNVQVDEMKQDIEDREALLGDAKKAIDGLEAKIKELERELKDAGRMSSEMSPLQETIRQLQQEIREYQMKVQDALEKAATEQQRGDILEEQNRELQRELAEQAAALKSIPVPVATHNVRIQTDEPLLDNLKELEKELQQVKEELQETKESCETKDKKIRELELDVLRVSNKMAAMATDHAQQMQRLTDEINKLKLLIEDKEELLRQKDKDILELNRRMRELERQLREVTDTAEQLRSKLTAKEEECNDKDRENEELRRKIRDLQDELERLRNKMAALERTIRDRDEEIENLKRLLRQKELEYEELKATLSQLRAELAEKERALIAARTAAHSTNMSSQEISHQVTQLRSDIQRLEEELRKETKLKNEAQADSLAKDEMIIQLRNNLRSTQARLTELEERLLEATTVHAAEKGTLQGTIDDLTRQLEQNEVVIRNLKSEVAQLRGENDALRREVEKLRREITNLLSKIDDLEQNLKEKQVLLEHSQETIDSLQGALDELSQNKNKGVSDAELLRLQGLIKSQEHALRSKDTELLSLRQALQTKDEIILELQSQLGSAKSDRQRLEETILILNGEKEELKSRIAELEVSSSHNLEEAKRVMEDLQEQVRNLETQIRELSKSPKRVISVETTPTKGEGSPSSTTMIIGALSENLLLLILQKLDELYREIIAGRSEESHANSSLSAKLDELSRLQKQLKSLYRKKGEDGVDLPFSAKSELDELQQMNERIIHELERERERVRAEGQDREQLIELLRGELTDAKRRILELELQLSNKNSLQEELDRLRGEVRRLQLLLEEEESTSRKLRIELMESRLANLKRPQPVPREEEEEEHGSVTSLPDLYSTRTRDHYWTSSSFTLGERPDLSELIEKHREVTRLNRELQKRCEERLRTSPRSKPTPPKGGVTSSSYWESRLKEQEMNGKRERRESERRLNERILLLEEKVRVSEEQRQVLQEQLASAVMKEEEIESLVTSLQAADQKKQRLEKKLEEILKEKNSKIHELELRIAELQEHQGMYSPATDGELRNLRRSITSLREEKAQLMSQLTNCKEQVITLQQEIESHQHHIHDNSTDSSPSNSGRHLSILSLLEQIKALRRQLETSIHNNSSLHDLLTSKQSGGSTQWGSPRLSTGTNTSSRHTVRKSYREEREEKEEGVDSMCSPPYSTFIPGAASTAHIHRTRLVTSGSLEERIRRALNSPNCGGLDKEFLQELLLYLQQQRHQLDESQRLLNDLQHQEIPSVSHITVSHTREGEGGEEEEEVERVSSRASSVDLSLLHDQVKRTHEAIKESKKILKSRSRKHHQS